MGNCHRRTRPPSPVITVHQPQTYQRCDNPQTLYELPIQKANSSETSTDSTLVTPCTGIPRPTLIPPPPSF